MSQAGADSHDNEMWGERLRASRVRAGKTMAEVGDVLGVTTQAINNYEKREGGCLSAEKLFLVADYLGVDARWLATGVMKSDVPPEDTEGLGSTSARLDYAMRRAGFVSQSELERESGVPQATISRTLSCGAQPELRTVQKLARACGVSAQWLIEGTGWANVPTAVPLADREWLELRESLGSEDIAEFTAMVRARQDRNRRLLAELGGSASI